MIIGIMGAMPDEVDQLCAKLENVTVEPVSYTHLVCQISASLSSRLSGTATMPLLGSMVQKG